MKNTLILIDFDHTIFNTTKYVAVLKERLQVVGIAPDVFDAKRQYLKDCCSIVDIDAFALQLPVTDKGLLHDTIHDVIADVAATCVHDDVRDFIVRNSTCADIVIVTSGDRELQSEKVMHSALPQIKELIITKEPKDRAVEKLIPLYEKVIFIDDKTKHIDEMKQAYPHIKAYHLRRPDDMPYGAIPSQCACTDYEIHSLEELNVC